jgi:hypothetical protein
LSWIENHANKRIHATTGEAPVERLKKEHLLEFTHKSAYVEKAKRPLFVFNQNAMPEVQVRELSIYEEVAL